MELLTLLEPCGTPEGILRHMGAQTGQDTARISTLATEGGQRGNIALLVSRTTLGGRGGRRLREGQVVTSQTQARTLHVPTMNGGHTLSRTGASSTRRVQDGSTGHSLLRGEGRCTPGVSPISMWNEPERGTVRALWKVPVRQPMSTEPTQALFCFPVNFTANVRFRKAMPAMSSSTMPYLPSSGTQGHGCQKLNGVQPEVAYCSRP